MMAEASGASTQTTVDENAMDQPIPSDAEWYVVNTYSGYEAKVKQNMEQRVRSMEATDKVFRIVVPEEDVEESRHGQRRTVKRKMYPGYVLVNMLSLDETKNSSDAQAKRDADAAWQVVRNTPGVVNFVGADAGGRSQAHSAVAGRGQHDLPANGGRGAAARGAHPDRRAGQDHRRAVHRLLWHGG